MNINQHGNTTSVVSQKRPEDENRYLGRLRITALITLLVGAGGALGLMLRAGHHNKSLLLIVLMAIWVLSPFLALLWACVVSKRWSTPTRATLYSMMLILPLASLADYGVDAWRQPRTQAAFVFVVVPPASWLLMAIVILMAIYRSVRLSRRSLHSKADNAERT